MFKSVFQYNTPNFTKHGVCHPGLMVSLCMDMCTVTEQKAPQRFMSLDLPRDLSDTVNASDEGGLLPKYSVARVFF